MTDAAFNPAAELPSLTCPRCGLSLEIRSRLAIRYCPRCLGRSRSLIELFSSPLAVGALHPDGFRARDGLGKPNRPRASATNRRTSSTRTRPKPGRPQETTRSAPTDGRLGTNIKNERQSMEHTVEYDIGSKVECRDGDCGELSRVVVDPVAVAITHLVVEPKHRHGTGHLVPIDLVASAADGIQLRCTTAEFQALDDAEDIQFLPGASGRWGYEQDQMLSLPYYGLPSGGMGGMNVGGVEGLGVTGMGGVGLGAGPHAITVDHVPVGDVEVRRGDHVHATDGPIGRVQGLAMNPTDHHVTHVLLDEGHLWDKKRVAIPISAVTRVGDEVRLTLTKDEVRDLPPVALEDPK
jgi:sporulation protein YlmC with PRC-barrel domain